MNEVDHSWSKVFDIISYLCPSPKYPDKLVFWRNPRPSIFPNESCTLYLNWCSIPDPGIYHGRLNPLSKLDMGSTISRPERLEIPETQLVKWDSRPAVSAFCNIHVGNIYPVALHVFPGYCTLYAEEYSMNAMEILKDFSDINIYKTWHTAFRRMYQMDCDVEFVGAHRKNGFITDIHEFARIPPRGEDIKEQIMKTHKLIMDDGWTPVILEVIDNRCLNYKPNIILWYYKEEGTPLSQPQVSFHMLDDNKNS